MKKDSSWIFQSLNMRPLRHPQTSSTSHPVMQHHLPEECRTWLTLLLFQSICLSTDIYSISRKPSIDIIRHLSTKINKMISEFLLTFTCYFSTYTIGDHSDLLCRQHESRLAYQCHLLVLTNQSTCNKCHSYSTNKKKPYHPLDCKQTTNHFNNILVPLI